MTRMIIGERERTWLVHACPGCGLEYHGYDEEHVRQLREGERSVNCGRCGTPHAAENVELRRVVYTEYEDEYCSECEGVLDPGTPEIAAGICVRCYSQTPEDRLEAEEQGASY